MAAKGGRGTSGSRDSILVPSMKSISGLPFDTYKEIRLRREFVNERLITVGLALQATVACDAILILRPNQVGVKSCEPEGIG